MVKEFPDTSLALFYIKKHKNNVIKGFLHDNSRKSSNFAVVGIASSLQGTQLRDIKSKDDVFTVLVHLGYLSFDENRHECYIPNREVRIEMANAVEDTNWERLHDALEASEQLLEATIEGNEEAVALAIDKAYDSNTSILSYNDENSLACVLSIAYYHAMNDYIIHRELATGKGFADLVFIPRRNVDKPAMVIELKFNKDTVAAIEQIHRKEYKGKALEYTDNLLLVGINYDKESKTHTCVIEKLQ